MGRKQCLALNCKPNENAAWKKKTILFLSTWAGKCEAYYLAYQNISSIRNKHIRSGRCFQASSCYTENSSGMKKTTLINKQEERDAVIRYVEWAGSRGLLPLQTYRNVMRRKDYVGWLRKPLPTDWEEDTHTSNVTGITGNKLKAENKASKPLNPSKHLQPIYVDSHIIVVNKESGALSVPGPRRNPSVGGLVHEYFGNEEDDVDCMIVHRLDMDTSGVICYARSKYVLSILHDAFRSKSGVGEGDETVFKQYEALVCGHVSTLASEGEIDLPLVRDQNHPPFMKVGIDPSEERTGTNIDVNLQKHRGYIKMMSKAPKESLTLFRVLGWEQLGGLPVTRLELRPITGRTHQLRVHCAAIGHPIVGDNIYGFNGDGSMNAGLPEEAMDLFQSKASDSEQQNLFNLVQQRRREGDCDGEGKYSGNLCLHAKQLTLLHPITKAPMSFETNTPF